MPAKKYYNFKKIMPDGTEKLVYRAQSRKYRTPKAVRLYAEDVKQMFDLANTDEKKAIISALYLTGRRPSEIMMWTKNMFQWNEDKLIITAPTLKVKDTGSFYDPEKPFIARIPKDRTDPSYCYIKTLLLWVHALPLPNERVFKKTVRWMRSIVEELSMAVLGRPFSPYHFRHSLLSFAADAGYSDRQLMALKNSKSPQSVQDYVHNTTVEMDYSRLQRGRFEQHDSMPEIKQQAEVQPQEQPIPSNCASQPEQPASQPEATATAQPNTSLDSILEKAKKKEPDPPLG